VIAELGIGPAEREAKLFAAEHRVPLWRGLVATWFKESKKRKRSPAPKVAPAPKPDMPAVEDPTPVAGVVSEERSRPAPRATGVAARGIALDESSPEFAGAKRDSRPARQGWAPGAFLRRCASCHVKFVGALNSATCADCAYETEPVA